MSNATKFLNAYSIIDRYFSRNNSSGRYHSFTSSVNYYAKHNNVINWYRDDLIEYGQLRNAIVHDRVDGTEIIAEPHDRVVEKIQTIANLLDEPLTLKEFKFKELLVCEMGDPFAQVLQKMNQKGYSQVPVLENQRIVNVLSSSMIVHYIYKHIRQDKVEFDGVQIRDVLENETQHFNVVQLDRSIISAIEFFNKSHGTGQPISALIVREPDSPKSKLVGLLTLKDLPELINLISKD